MPIFQSVLQWFQFTHPGRGATEEDAEIEQHNFVSIHAPREGCDAMGIDLWFYIEEFQFTHPGRGATETRRADGRIPEVSIHAPREGCD